MFKYIKKALFGRRKEAISREIQAKEHQDISDAYFRLFNTDDGKYVLDHMVMMNLTGSIAMQNDTLIDIGEKQGRANLVKDIIMRITKK